MKKEKLWMTLNEHGKECLLQYLNSISANDIKTSQLDYLHKKDLTDYTSNFKDGKFRMPISTESLTDLGIETAKHYFPNQTKGYGW